MGCYKTVIRISTSALILLLGLLIQSGKLRLSHEPASRGLRIWDLDFTPVSINSTAAESHRSLLLAIDPLCRHCNELLNENVSLLTARCKDGTLGVVSAASTTYLQASGWSKIAGVKLFRVKPENFLKLGINRFPMLLVVDGNGTLVRPIEGKQAILSALRTYGM